MSKLLTAAVLLSATLLHSSPSQARSAFVEDTLDYAYEVYDLSEDDAEAIALGLEEAEKKQFGAMMFCAKAKGGFLVLSLGGMLCTANDLRTWERRTFASTTLGVGALLNPKFDGMDQMKPSGVVGVSILYLRGPGYEGLSSIPGDYKGLEIEGTIKWGGGVAIAGREAPGGTIMLYSASAYFGYAFNTGFTAFSFIDLSSKTENPDASTLD